MTTFGNRMRDTRKNANLTLEELAEKLKTTKATLSRYENDKRVPDIYIAKAIARVLRVDINFLLYGNNEVETIAAHHEGEDYTKEELEQIEAFKAFVRSKRENKDNRGD